MNANETYDEISLAAYELAVSERLEREAKATRIKAARRLARVAAWFKDGIETATREPNKEYSKTP